ncbi:MAG TPA: DUF302 domain-containing protein [Acidisphaera sp.]|nr:DUF302 domain-containing protein [Acidisphaera sp.]
MSDPAPSDIEEHVAPTDFATTIERLTKAIADAGMMLFASIDHAAGARAADLNMPPATVLIYGHAKGGTPVMLAVPQAALDLPLRVLVRQRDDGRTVVAFHPVASMLRRAGVPDALATRLEPAQRLLVNAIAQ